MAFGLVPKLGYGLSIAQIQTCQYDPLPRAAMAPLFTWFLETLVHSRFILPLSS